MAKVTQYELDQKAKIALSRELVKKSEHEPPTRQVTRRMEFLSAFREATEKFGMPRKARRGVARAWVKDRQRYKVAA